MCGTYIVQHMGYLCFSPPTPCVCGYSWKRLEQGDPKAEFRLELNLSGVGNAWSL